jgi:hypothetical protein
MFFNRQSALPIGTNCALLADLFLYSYEADFIQGLLKKSFVLNRPSLSISRCRSRWMNCCVFTYLRSREDKLRWMNCCVFTCLRSRKNKLRWMNCCVFTCLRYREDKLRWMNCCVFTCLRSREDKLRWMNCCVFTCLRSREDKLRWMNCCVFTCLRSREDKLRWMNCCVLPAYTLVKISHLNLPSRERRLVKHNYSFTLTYPHESVGR